MKILFEKNACIKVQLLNGTVIEGRVTDIKEEDGYVLIKRILRGRQLTEENKDVCVNTQYIVCWEPLGESDFDAMRMNINLNLIDVT